MMVVRLQYKNTFSHKKKEFTKEVIIQSQFSHRNIVKLLGCCVEADAPMLITEFVPKGNLSDLLHHLNADEVPLPLDTRLQIASGIAEALVYMHTSQSHPILHGDIKPEKIFLDNNYVPKLSDFGISRLLSMSSDEYTGYVIGSMGCIDPEFCRTGRLSTKSDVYSFGVVLLELTTRRKAIDLDINFLAKTFSSANTKSSRHEYFDKEIAATESIEVLDDIVNLALECVKFELEKRPEMRDVSQCIRKIQKTQEEKRRQEIISSLQRSFKRFITREKINNIINDFKNNPTECFMGKIYRGTSGKISCLAIEMSFNVRDEVLKEFYHQIILHSKVKHENVVKFEGCCMDGDSPILVYESANASLHDILFRGGTINCTIDCLERYKIAVSIAKGLSYLHSLGIVHGDVRTANMLVTNDIPKFKVLLFNVQIKVSGIGASVYFSMVKAAHERIKAENNGYMDPRFLESGVFNKETDIYSLGVVLLELFTGRMVSNRIRKYRIEELWENAVCYHIKETRKIISRCLDPDVSRRPKLEEVITWFREEQRHFWNDRLDGHFCGDDCRASTGGAKFRPLPYLAYNHEERILRSLVNF
ncbi:hypothetical protein PR202_ga07307 [Eleusine coracana subsp. coracana]|uniref:Protein kinase domain-containing protein n=1 Tax=Eleusine coracana subsp. coracana TaxID=191504 RepID=A0AAV5BX98_ELECO|nr:hypothetical protein PR202_ga07307 [Eleusine coracana subsp. coracana]